MTTTAITILRDLFLPRACVACATPGTWWCQGCDLEVRGPVVLARTADLTVCAAARYEGAARALVLGLKERHLTALAQPVGTLLDRAIRAHPQIATATAIVPVPGSSRGWRSRGFDVVDLALGREPPLPVAHCLTWDRRRRAQKSLTRSARVSNLVDALSCRVTVPQALIVDDVVTSGATVTEAIRAIEAAGGSVVGIASVAHTPPVGGPIGRAGATTR